MNKESKHWTDKLDNLLFYKYRGGLGDNECNLKLISNNSVWFDNPKNFNDPFDCYPIPGRRSPERIHAVIQRTINNTENTSLSDENREQMRIQYEANPDAAVDIIDTLSTTQWYAESFMKNYLVFSLSKSPLIRLMWSHYANNHKGFVIEFNLLELFKKEQRSRENVSIEDSFLPLPVKYQKDRPEIHDESLEYSSDPLFIKDDIWKYEEEYRMLRTGNRRLVDFDPLALSSVILGARVCPDVKKRIQDTVFEFNRDHPNKISIFYAELSKSSYELHIPGHPDYEGNAN